MYHYALIDADGVVYGESWLSGEVEKDNMITVPEGVSVVPNAQRWNGTEFEDYDAPEVEEPLSDMEETINNMAINMEYLVCLNELNDI